MGTEQMPGNSPQPKGMVMRVHTIAVIAACVILLVVAFIAGMLVATDSYRPDVQDDVSSDEQVDEVDEVDDGGTEREGEIVVNWYPTDAQQTREFNFFLRRWWETTYENAEYRPETTYNAVILGEVADGEYAGRYLVEETVSTDEGMGGSFVAMYVLEEQKSDTNPILLRSYTVSEGWGPFADLAPDLANDAEDVMVSDDTIDGMNFAASLSSDDGTAMFTWIGLGRVIEDRAGIIADYPVTVRTATGTNLREFSFDSEKTSMSGVPNEFFTIRPDGRPVWYTVDTPGWTTSSEQRVQTPDITWNDGSAVAEYFRGSIGGCGFQTLTNVVDEVPDIDAAGYVNANSALPVSVPADYGDPLLADDYQYWVNLQKVQSETADTSIAAFASGYPVFYMLDPVGRWVKFTRTDVVPPGECGKPVIYLYPQTTTKIDVSLAPEGGFTKSEPAYNDGWHVIAESDGTLTNLGDGLTYPYLFWEGRGGLYSAPAKYWVVAQADVHTFLATTLAKLGLNAQESADFMEFWEPRMQSAPYYKIGFHGTNVMDAIAPMTLSQSPDTVLRILMDFSELSAPIAANPPKLPSTPVRKGFTVIEWGGVIR